MVTETLTLTEFLLARIAETEEWVEHPLFSNIVRRHMLAECGAKRRIVQTFTWDDLDGEVSDPRGVLANLASVYADHPDYRIEWA